MSPFFRRLFCGQGPWVLQVIGVSIPSRLRIRAQAGVLLVISVVQVPLVAASAHFSWWLTLGVATFAAVVSLPIVGQMLRSPWDHKPRSALHKYVVMWPFYSWWTLCLMFALTAPALGLLAALTSVTATQALLVALGLGVVAAFRALRPRAHVAKQRLLLPRLPPAFDGFKIVHLSDIHCGPFTPAGLVSQWVARANALKPDLIVVTGDLITTGSEYIDEMAAALAKLRAPCGVLACLGNHDYFGTDGAVGPALEREGIAVLNNRGFALQRPGGELYIAGVDDNWSGREDLACALRQRPDNVATVLLAHDPNLFHKAIAAHVDLTLSGHTHGGQFAVPWMVRRFNLARMVTPFTSGLYRHGQSLLYVNHGLGTSGPPIRLGARPELALLTLVAGAAAAERSQKGHGLTKVTRALVTG